MASQDGYMRGGFFFFGGEIVSTAAAQPAGVDDIMRMNIFDQYVLTAYSFLLEAYTWNIKLSREYQIKI